MTDKKRIDEAVKKEIAAAEAQPEPKDVAAPQSGNAVPPVTAEPPQPPSPPEKPCDDTSRLVDAILGLNAKIGALEDGIAALKSENARLSAENARLGAPVDYAAAIENDERAEAAAIASERVRNAVVAAYLKNLGSAERISVLTGSNGAIPLAPPAKPKSLAEAKKLAEILIKG
nr:MAG TPA: Initiation-control protein YabA, DnaA, DnaN, Zinc finger.7A [Caudoviricetes sp.]